MKSSAPVVGRGPIYGGRPVAHIHSRGETFLLARGQWKEFSQQVLAEVGAKLKDASNVPFQTLLELAEAAAKL